MAHGRAVTHFQVVGETGGHLPLQGDPQGRAGCLLQGSSVFRQMQGLPPCDQQPKDKQQNQQGPRPSEGRLATGHGQQSSRSRDSRLRDTHHLQGQMCRPIEVLWVGGGCSPNPVKQILRCYSHGGPIFFSRTLCTLCFICTRCSDQCVCSRRWKHNYLSVLPAHAAVKSSCEIQQMPFHKASGIPTNQETRGAGTPLQSYATGHLQTPLF